MKTWILPSIAVAAVVFLMTRPGRELQDQIGDNFDDWTDTVARSAHRLQLTLRQVETVLDRVNRTLQQASG